MVRIGGWSIDGAGSSIHTLGNTHVTDSATSVGSLTPTLPW
jgi:hypothetical protein